MTLNKTDKKFQKNDEWSIYCLVSGQKLDSRCVIYRLNVTKEGHFIVRDLTGKFHLLDKSGKCDNWALDEIRVYGMPI